MKKIFPILLVTMILGLFSSCILITPESEETYRFYFFNNSEYEIRDWYLIDRSGNTYSKYNDGYACSIDSGEISSIKDLKKQDYKLYYEYYRSSHINSCETDYIEIYSDTTYKFKEDAFYDGAPRSAETVTE